MRTVAQNIAQHRRSFDAVIKASNIASQWDLPRQTVPPPIMEKHSCQFINRSEGMKSVVTTYQVLEPSFLSSASHLDIEVEAKQIC